MDQDTLVFDSWKHISKMSFDEDNYYVELSKAPIRFEPVSKVTNVFFDDSNRQVSIYLISKSGHCHLTLESWVPDYSYNHCHPQVIGWLKSSRIFHK